jgi:hypothetical protein
MSGVNSPINIEDVNTIVRLDGAPNSLRARGRVRNIEKTQLARAAVELGRRQCFLSALNDGPLRH